MHKNPAKMPFLLIGGAPRSGTTVLAQMLNSDPSIYLSLEHNVMHFMRYFSFRERDTNPEDYQKANFNTIFADYMTSDVDIEDIEIENVSEVEAIVAPIVKHKTLQKERTASAREVIFDPENFLFSMSNIQNILKYAYQLHAHQIEKPNLKIFGDKYPLYFMYLDYILKLPFNVKYIHITRNPYDTVNSMMFRTNKMREGTDDYWNEHYTDPRIMEGVWNLAFETITHYEKLSDKILHIQYEDLIFDHANTVKKIETFLGAPLDINYPIKSDAGVHFTRESLTNDVKKSIASNPIVQQYSAYLQANSIGAASLKHLPLATKFRNHIYMAPVAADSIEMIQKDIYASLPTIWDNYYIHWQNSTAQINSLSHQLARQSIELAEIKEKAAMMEAHWHNALNAWEEDKKKLEKFEKLISARKPAQKTDN